MNLSVVMASYNGEKYILQQLESIRTQVRQADEVYIVDDCSTDGTVERIKAFIKEHQLKNWCLHVHKENQGWKKSFMEAIEGAKGDLIFPCDQDDIWFSEKLQSMEEMMQKNPRIQLLCSLYKRFCTAGKSCKDTRREDGELILLKARQNIFETAFPGCTYCIRKSLVQQGKAYWEADFPHDAFFWRLAMFSESLYLYKRRFVLWRKHPDSAYALESLALKRADKKKAWLYYALRMQSRLLCFAEEQKGERRKEYTALLQRVRMWLLYRLRFYETGSLRDWLKLAPYHACYDRLRQYFGDLYLRCIRRE